MFRGKASLCTMMGAFKARASAVGLAVRLELLCADANEKTSKAYHSTNRTMKAIVCASIVVCVGGVPTPFFAHG